MVTVQSLGNAEIQVGDVRIVPASVRKFALMLYLSAERGRRVPRVTLQDLIFPEQESTNAKHSLRELVYQLRRKGAQIVSDTESIELRADDVQSDVSDLINADRLTATQLRAAAGGLLPGYAPAHSEAFSEWLERYRAQTIFEVCKALHREITRARRVSDWMMTEQAARACLALDPLHEEATLALAEMMALGGAKAQAVDLLDQYAREVGHNQSDLRLPATIAKRRISERVRDGYRAPLTLPFLGRDREMESLNERFELAKGGESQCVVLVGESGIGKTRIADEFCTQAVLNGSRVERVVMQPHDKHRPMGLFIELVPRLLEMPGAIGSSPESMAALKRLTTHHASDAATVPSDVSSEVVSSAITRAISDLLDAISSETMMVLLIDDVQWADELSQRTLSVLLSARQSRRVLAILTSRERDVAQFFARRSERVLRLSIAQLADSAMHELFNRLGDDQRRGLDGELQNWFAYASGGNPFFLRLLIGHFLSTGERFVVPTTVSSLLDQQVAALGPEATAVVEMCAILGRHAEVPRLIRALELPHIQLQIALRELEAAQLIAQQEARLEPAHWLVSEAVLRAMTDISRRLLHRRAATILGEETADSHSASQLWDCAEHWLLAGEPERGTQLMRACASHAIEIGQPREAAEILLRAAALVGEKDRGALINQAVQIADRAGEVDVLLRGARLARSYNLSISYDGFELAEIRARIAVFEDSDGGAEQIREYLSPDRPLHQRIKAGLTAVVLADQLRNPAFAHEAFTTLLPILERGSLVDDIEALKLLTIYHSTFGNIETSRRTAGRMIKLAEGLDPATAADLQRKSGVALWQAGDVDGALTSFESAYANAQAAGLLRAQCLVASMISSLSFDITRDQSAETWIQRAQEASVLAPDYRDSFPYAAGLADVGCIHDDLDAIRKWRDIAVEGLRNRPTIKTKRWIRVFDARIRQLEQSNVDVQRVVGDLVNDHAPHTETGDLSDAEIAVAIHVLIDANQLDRSRQMLHRYLKEFRRSRAPLARTLQNAVKRLGLYETEARLRNTR